MKLDNMERFCRRKFLARCSQNIAERLVRRTHYYSSSFSAVRSYPGRKSRTDCYSDNMNGYTNLFIKELVLA